jgi:preprotein translocase subunit SecB
VTVTATVTTTVGDRTLFLVEAKQAGIFEIRNVPQDQLQLLVGVACPQTLHLPARHRLRRVHPPASRPSCCRK